MKILAFCLFILLSSCSKIPTSGQVKAFNPSSFKEILDRDGQLIHETRVDFQRHRRAWTPLADLPSEFIHEAVFLEDQRFYSHPGFDPIAIMSAITEYPNRGASTITMQLAGLLKKNRGSRDLRAKLLQIFSAVELELTWSKQEILEAWFNLVSFRGELQGIRSASLALFKKDPKLLNQSERLILLSLLPSPNQSRRDTLRRACWYARKMKRNCDGIRLALEDSYLDSPVTELQENLAPHIAQKLSKHKFEKVTTTLDKKIQSESVKILQSHLRQLRNQNVKDGAILVIEKASGNILAYVGSSGDHSSSRLVDHVQSLRQAGSTLKPLLYASALKNRLITMTSPLRDEPFSVTREGLTYQPENYQKGFTFQDVPAKVALGSSLNIPAVRVIDYLGPERFFHLLQELEFRGLYDQDYYGHSMALGSVDVTLWDLVRSYRTLSMGGNFSDLQFLPNEDRSSKLVSDFSPQVSFIIGHILSEKNNRHLTFGIQSTLSSESWSAVKTGTSKDMRDNWCIGFTDEFVIGVWVGNSSGEPMWNVTGISGAAPVFSQIVSLLHETRPSVAPVAPKNLVQLGDDYYLKGTEPKKRGHDIIDEPAVAKIVFPQSGAQFAFDPEIPIESQKVLFQATNKDSRWRLNGERMTPEEVRQGFLPSRQGRYVLELLDEKNSIQDKAVFYVKAGKSL